MQELPFISRARIHGTRTAIRDQEADYTYQDLLDASATIAGNLLGDGHDLAEERVAFQAPAGFNYLALQWGIWRAGGVAVPLGMSATKAELDHALSDSGASRMLVMGTPSPHHSDAEDCRILRTFGDVMAPSNCELPDIAPQRRAMILFTSGTTSKPKGVVTTHAMIAAQVGSLIEAWEWSASDRIPLFLPMHHVHGIVNVAGCALWAGASIEAFAKFDTEQILSRVAAGAYSVFMAVPTIYVKLLELLEPGVLPPERREGILRGFAQMRLMVSGSAALPASIHGKWAALTGQQLLERYGMTETGMMISNPLHGERRPGAVGLPLPGVELRLKSEIGEIIEREGEAGEIQVRGAGVFCEYWNRAEATAESFDDGWFKTGDLAVIEQSYFRIMGRLSVDIIKSGGYKLSALEIEAVLLEHPEIRECAVVGVPDDTWGERVATAVVLADQAVPLHLQDLRTWCHGRMSPYKVPRELRVVTSLPRNAMGKVTKRAVAHSFLG